MVRIQRNDYHHGSVDFFRIDGVAFSIFDVDVGEMVSQKALPVLREKCFRFIHIFKNTGIIDDNQLGEATRKTLQYYPGELVQPLKLETLSRFRHRHKNIETTRLGKLCHVCRRKSSPFYLLPESDQQSISISCS